MGSFGEMEKLKGTRKSAFYVFLRTGMGVFRKISLFGRDLLNVLAQIWQGEAE
jgi:hypothetical protein